MFHLSCGNSGNITPDSLRESRTQFALRINKSDKQCFASGINFMIGIWPDQCGPACLPRSAWSTSNPQVALHYHQELDTVMTVPSGCEPRSPHHHCRRPDPSAGIGMHYHDPNYQEF